VWRENCRGRKWQELDQWKLKILSLVGLVVVRCNMSVFSPNWGIFVYTNSISWFFFLRLWPTWSETRFGLHELCF
jgi:hypothetical protein